MADGLTVPLLSVVAELCEPLTDEMRMRMRKRGRVPALLGLLVGCGGPTVPGQPISVLDNTFVPSLYRAAVGDTVTWIWSGNNAHDVRFGDGGASSAVMTLGEFKRAFPTVGTFNYICTLHGGMVGTIIVQ